MDELRIPAIVAAGDRGSAKAVRGESKVYLELGGRPLVARVVSTLQCVAEVSEVWVVGDAPRLEAVLGAEDVKRELRKPLHIVPQGRNLFENAWEGYRRVLSRSAEEGRDPGDADRDVRVLYLSADLPFATAQEISEFVRRGATLDCVYAVGLVPEEAMESFYPERSGAPGIRMAYFNLSEGRFRQSNLHLVKPALLTNRHYIQEMYDHRYQKQFGQIIALAWRILRIEEGGLRILLYYLLMHLAGVADRRGWRRIADWLRRRISLAQVEEVTSRLMRARLRFVVTQAGGCAVDIDNERDYDAARARFDDWRASQERRAEQLYGKPSVAPRAGAAQAPIS